MGSRLELHAVLTAITEHAYFQPPGSENMLYPCIRYKRETIQTTNANNENYTDKTLYQVMVIDEDPDSPIVREVLKLPLCRHSQNYAADGLNHDVFELYY